nr:unnamed protein product [Spirometra erinaceieuropaei]
MTAKSAKDDRRQYWTEIATSVEQASNVGDTRKLNQLIRQVSGKPPTLSDSVREVNGGFMAENSVKVERWREHFEHHLNFDAQPTSPLLSSSAEFLPSTTYAVSCDPPPPLKEVADVIRKLRKNKAPSEDGMHAEIFKSCVDTLAHWIHEAIERAWRDEVVLDDWGLGILVPILKKGIGRDATTTAAEVSSTLLRRSSLLSYLGDSSLCVTQGRGPTKPDFVLDVDVQTTYSHWGAFSNFAIASNNRRSSASLNLPPCSIPFTVSPCSG